MSIIIDPWFCSSPINLHLMKDNNITDNWLFVWSKGYLKGGLSSDRTYIFCSGCCHIKISKFNIIERYGIDRNFLSKYYKNSHVFLTLQSWWLTNQTLFDFFNVIYNIFWQLEWSWLAWRRQLSWDWHYMWGFSETFLRGQTSCLIEAWKLKSDFLTVSALISVYGSIIPINFCPVRSLMR